jgi:hypothetical protein
MTNDSIETKIGRLDEKVGFVITEIKYLRDGVFTDIADLKQNKADNKEVERIQSLVNEVQHKLNNNIEGRVSVVEATKADFRQKLADNGKYLKLIIGLGCFFFVSILGVIIYLVENHHI